MASCLNLLLDLICNLILLKNRVNYLIELSCSHTRIKSIDNLPSGLKKLNCSSNGKLSSLDNLANSLTMLKCLNMGIISLNNLPNSLVVLDCSYNNIISLHNLPNSLTELTYSFNNIQNIAEIKIAHPNLNLVFYIIISLFAIYKLFIYTIKI